MIQAGCANKDKEDAMAFVVFASGDFNRIRAKASHEVVCSIRNRKTKKVAALGSLPKAATTPAAASDLSVPLREFEKAMNRLSTNQHAQ